MKLNEFDSLVWKYGASGTKELEGYSDRVKDAVFECWSRIQDELDEEDDDFEEKSKLYINGHYKESLYHVYWERYSDGWAVDSGMVDYAGDSTSSLDFAMDFETEEEAEEWIAKHKEEWGNTELHVG